MNFFSIFKYMLPMSSYPFEGTTVPCPICEETSFTQVASIDRRLKRLSTVMCDQCGLLYTNPMPTEAELSTYYQDYYRFDYQLATTAPKPRHIMKRQNEARQRLSHLHGFVESGIRTLDFGAGSGEFVSLMVENQLDAHGFEPGSTYAQHAIQTLGERFQNIGWQEAKFSAEFDLITCFHVLEHLSTPKPALRRMASWLRPGGKIYIEVPDMAAFLEQKGFGCMHFAHVLGFNRYNLILAAAQVGLRPVREISPTGIIFERGTPDNKEALAFSGSQLTRSILEKNAPIATYFRYQFSKLGGRRLPTAQVET